MSDIPKEILFDVRMVERHIRSGLIKREDYEKYLAELADVQAEADPINLDELDELTANRQLMS
ncbi:MAG: hypothetical protein JW841_15695 [Deltaproteobacteria bacterium]|nr:hypothetical protein [Deltaproteobacteria bacterium]